MKNTLSVVATISIALLTACGGGGGSTGNTGNPNPSIPTYSGQYIDAPTKGLFYHASPSGINGYTDNNGTFTFQANDSVLFTIQAPNGAIDAGTIKPTTPANTSTVIVASVLDMPNGVAIAQTLQSLGGTGSVIDVSATAANVSALSRTDITDISKYIRSGGVAAQPAAITIDSTTALSNAAKSLSNISSTQSSVSTLSGLTAFNIYTGGLNANSMNLTAQGLGAGFGYFEASGKLFNICSYQAPTQLSVNVSWTSCDSTVPVGGQLANWTVSTTSSGNLQIVETTSAGSQVGSVNTVTSSSSNSTNGYFSNAITNIPTLPAGFTQSGNGMYSVMQSDFGISSLASKTIVVSGDANCSDGKMKYTINSTGAAYTKTCNLSSAAGSSFTSTTGTTANYVNLPGIVTFTDLGATAANIKYVGVGVGGSLSSGGTGKAAVVTVGTSVACGLTNKSSCGIAGLFDYTIQ